MPATADPRGSRRLGVRGHRVERLGVGAVRDRVDDRGAAGPLLFIPISAVVVLVVMAAGGLALAGRDLRCA